MRSIQQRWNMPEVDATKRRGRITVLDAEDGAEAKARSMFGSWPAVERRRLQVALDSVAKALQSRRESRQGDSKHVDMLSVLHEVADKALAKVDGKTSIGADARLAASLRKRIEAMPEPQANPLPDTPEPRSHTRRLLEQRQLQQQGLPVDDGSASERVRLQRQLAAVQFRLEQKRAIRAVVWLLAIVSYVLGGDALLNRVLATPSCCH